METLKNITESLNKGKINNELEFEQALIYDRKLRVLAKSDSKYKPIRKELRNLIKSYEKTNWIDVETISDEKIIESDIAENTTTTRKGECTPELSELVTETLKGIEFTYQQVYYLDYAVDENTGKVSLTEKEKFFKGSQVDRNLKNYKNAYYEAKRK